MLRPASKSFLRETVETVLAALLIALLIRTFLVQLYVVDGQSMMPTLHHGDRLLVNKLIYRIREPKPGEVVVLDDPVMPERRLIKRVIAVGGERVEVRNQTVLVDDQPLAETYTNPVSAPFSDVGVIEVPPGHVYVMGDNRGGSLDSRVFQSIPVTRVEGMAFYLFWPLDRLQGHGPLNAGRTRP